MLTALHIVYRTELNKNYHPSKNFNNLEETDQNTEPIQLQLPTYIKTSTT